MKVKTAELQGKALDYAVSVALGYAWSEGSCDPVNAFLYEHGGGKCWFSTIWTQGGPIIEREGITVVRCEDDWTYDSRGYWTEESQRIPVWRAVTGQHDTHTSYESERYAAQFEIPERGTYAGGTPLIAAMRCYVANELGDEVEIPEGLIK